MDDTTSSTSQHQAGDISNNNNNAVVDGVLSSLQPLRDLAKNWDIDIASWYVASTVVVSLLYYVYNSSFEIKARLVVEVARGRRGKSLGVDSRVDPAKSEGCYVAFVVVISSQLSYHCARAHYVY